MTTLLDAVIPNLVAEALIRAGDHLFGSAIRRVLGRSEEIRLKASIERALHELATDYAQLERVEGPAYILDSSFFTDETARAELLKVYRPDFMSRDVLVTRYIELYGYEELDKFQRNLSDFLRNLQEINWGLLPPGDQFQTSFLTREIRQLGARVESLIANNQTTQPASPIPSAETAKPSDIYTFSRKREVPDAIQDALATLTLAVQESLAQPVPLYRELVEEETQREIEKARSFLKQGDIKRGHRILSHIERSRARVLDDLPTTIRFDLFRLLGAVYLVQGGIETAESYLRRAEVVSPDDPRLFTNWAQLHLLKHEFLEAERLGIEAERSDSNRSQSVEVVIQAMLAQKKAEAALAWLRDIDVAEELEHIYVCWGQVYFALGDLDRAQEYLDKSLELKRNYAPADAFMGDVKLAKLYERIRTSAVLEQADDLLDEELLQSIVAHYTSAIKSYEHAGLLVQTEVIHVNLANALNLLRRPKEALVHIKKGLRNSPPVPEPWLVAARVARDSGQIELAEHWCTEAAKRAPDIPEPYFQLAEIRLSQSNPQGALSALSQAEAMCKSDRHKTELALFRADVYSQHGDSAGIRQALDSVPESARDLSDVMLAEAGWLRRAGDADGAQAILLKAAEKYPGNVSVAASAGRFLLYDKQNPKDAIPFLQKWVESAPSKVSYFHLAQSLFRLGQYQEALRVIDEARLAKCADDYLRRIEGGALLGRKRYREAVQVLETVPIDKRDFSSWCNLGAAWRLLGDRDRAIDAYENASRINEKQPELFLTLAELYLELEDNQNAYRYAQAALKLGEDDPDIHMGFFHTVFAAQREREALQVLMEIPKRFPEYTGLYAAGLDEVRRVFSEGQTRSQQALSEYLAGRMPFTILSLLLNLATVELWFGFRHDGLKQLCATGTLEEQRSERSLLPSSEVVVDYTALLTSQALGLFEVLPSIFDKIYVPSTVNWAIMSDRSRLIHTQRERLKHLKELKEFIGKYPRVTIHTDWINPPEQFLATNGVRVEALDMQDMILVKKFNAVYVCDNEANFEAIARLVESPSVGSWDILEVLIRDELLTAEEQAKAARYMAESRLVRVSPEYFLSHEDELVLSWHSLTSLFECEPSLLRVVAAHFRRIHISPSTWALLDKDALRSEVIELAIPALTEIENALKTNEKYEIVSSEEFAERDLDSEAQFNLADQVLDAISVAKEKGVPLWTDDLVTRRLAANDSTGPATICSRAVLDKTQIEQIFAPEIYCERVFFLLSSRYEFTSINSLLVYWLLEKHGFQDNPETQLVLTKLNETAKQIVANTSAGDSLKEYVLHLNEGLHSYWSVLSTAIALLWLIPTEAKPNIRNHWAKILLEQSMEVQSIFPSMDIVMMLIITSYMDIVSRHNLDAARKYYSFAWTYCWLRGLEDEFYEGLLTMVRAFEQADVPDDYRRSFIAELLLSVKGKKAPAMIRHYVMQAHPDWLTTSLKDS